LKAGEFGQEQRFCQLSEENESEKKRKNIINQLSPHQMALRALVKTAGMYAPPLTFGHCRVDLNEFGPL